MIGHGEDFYYRSADGLRLYCRIFGAEKTDLPTIICLPGLTRNSRDFIELATHLQKNYRILAPDLRGRGHSDYDSQWQNYQPNSYCADLDALLEALKVQRAAIIGTSLGALLALLMAIRQPSIIEGIVLNDAGPEVDPAGAARIASYVGQQTPVVSWADAIAQVRQTYGAALPGLSDDQWLRYARQSYKENERGAPLPDSDPAIGTLFRTGAATPQTLWPVFAQLNALPMLVIRGSTSDILSASTLARMAHEKPDLQQLTVANRGHAPLLNEPECVAAIDGFLKGLAD